MRLFFRAVRAARVGADREFIAPPRLTPASPPNNLALNSLRFIMQYSFGRLGSLFAVTARQSCARPYAGLTDASDSEKASYRRGIHRRDVTWRPGCNLEVRVNRAKCHCEFRRSPWSASRFAGRLDTQCRTSPSVSNQTGPTT